jgi:recombination protein RecA
MISFVAHESNCISLNDILEGDLPKGRLIEIVGDYDTYKTTTALRILSKLQDGAVAMYMNLKNDISLEFVDKLGVDRDRTVFFGNNRYEAVKEAIEEFAPHCDVIVIDSIANICSKHNDHEAAKKIIYLAAKMAARYDTTFILINHLIMNPETRQKISYASKTLSKYCSIRLKFSLQNVIVRRYVHVGHKVKIDPFRSKLGPMEPVFKKYYVVGGERK